MFLPLLTLLTDVRVYSQENCSQIGLESAANDVLDYDAINLPSWFDTSNTYRFCHKHEMQ